MSQQPEDDQPVVALFKALKAAPEIWAGIRARLLSLVSLCELMESQVDRGSGLWLQLDSAQRIAGELLIEACQQEALAPRWAAVLLAEANAVAAEQERQPAAPTPPEAEPLAASDPDRPETHRLH